jgi:hypothetical protein
MLPTNCLVVGFDSRDGVYGFLRLLDELNSDDWNYLTIQAATDRVTSLRAFIEARPVRPLAPKLSQAGRDVAVAAAVLATAKKKPVPAVASRPKHNRARTVNLDKLSPIVRQLASYRLQHDLAYHALARRMRDYGYGLSETTIYAAITEARELSEDTAKLVQGFLANADRIEAKKQQRQARSRERDQRRRERKRERDRQRRQRHAEARLTEMAHVPDAVDATPDSTPEAVPTNGSGHAESHG